MGRNTVPATPPLQDLKGKKIITPLGNYDYLRNLSRSIGVDFDSLDEETARKLSEFYTGSSTPRRREAIEATKRKNVNGY